MGWLLQGICAPLLNPLVNPPGLPRHPNFKNRHESGYELPMFNSSLAKHGCNKPNPFLEAYTISYVVRTHIPA